MLALTSIPSKSDGPDRLENYPGVPDACWASVSGRHSRPGTAGADQEDRGSRRLHDHEVTDARDREEGQRAPVRRLARPEPGSIRSKRQHSGSPRSSRAGRMGSNPASGSVSGPHPFAGSRSGLRREWARPHRPVSRWIGWTTPVRPAHVDNRSVARLRPAGPVACAHAAPGSRHQAPALPPGGTPPSGPG